MNMAGHDVRFHGFSKAYSGSACKFAGHSVTKSDRHGAFRRIMRQHQLSDSHKPSTKIPLNLNPAELESKTHDTSPWQWQKLCLIRQLLRMALSVKMCLQSNSLHASTKYVYRQCARSRNTTATYESWYVQCRAIVARGVPVAC